MSVCEVYIVKFVISLTLSKNYILTLMKIEKRVCHFFPKEIKEKKKRIFLEWFILGYFSEAKTFIFFVVHRLQ